MSRIIRKTGTDEILFRLSKNHHYMRKRKQKRDDSPIVWEKLAMLTAGAFLILAVLGE